MKLSELLAKPLSLIGGGKLNLKGFCKRVVDKEIGEGGDEFPYEYEVLNFDISIKTEDWEEIPDDEGYYKININLEEEQIPTLENILFIIGTMNETIKSTSDIKYISFTIDDHSETSFDFDYNIIPNVLNCRTDTPESYNLNFELIFIGDKK